MKIKNLKVNHENIMEKISLKRTTKGVFAIGLSTLLITGMFTGCYTTVTDDATAIYDTIDSTGENITIEPQVLDVPGEDFKLVVEYSLDDNASKKWKITDNKKITTTVYTQGLEEGTKVYIDNVHTDTTLVATKEQLNGITQDTMDDRIHNSLMYGFPIDDKTPLVCINEIEGQNDTFISGYTYGVNGVHSGSFTEKRYEEEEYLEEGVYANKISSSYGLLIQKGDNEPYGVDVSSDVVVIACNTIVKEKSDGTQKVYTYNRDGSYTLTEKTKVKTK